jgi:glutamyl-tRNA synthetase
MNGQYIYGMTADNLLEHLKPFLIQFDLMDELHIKQQKDWLLKICQLVKLRLKTLRDINEVGRYFFVEDFDYEEDGMKKHYNSSTIEIINAFLPKLEGIKEYSAQRIEDTVRSYAEENHLKARQIIHPLRLFITGKQGGPGLFETMELVGKERCLRRLRRLVNAFEKR